MEKTLHSAVNVEVIDESFYMPQLDRYRRIWVYKPARYYQTDKKYPVVYMHDGQNLFDESTAFGEEWGIDETLNSLQAECLVVGIDNSEYRLSEYNVHDHEEHGPGEGSEYLKFIVDTLKPAIDLNFRTKSGRSHTHIAGSSMGGLISLYGAMYFPQVFGGAGILSPALWVNPDIKEELKGLAKTKTRYSRRFYFSGGEKEGGNMVENINKVVDILRKHKKYDLYVEIDPEGEHTEDHWKNVFADYYKWLSAGWQREDW